MKYRDIAGGFKAHWIILFICIAMLQYNETHPLRASKQKKLDERTRREKKSPSLLRHYNTREVCVLCSRAPCALPHSNGAGFGLVQWNAWISENKAFSTICFCYVHLEMVERSMFGGITGALVVQNKPPLLLLAQAYSILNVSMYVRVCVFLCTVGMPSFLCILNEWRFICFKAVFNDWLWQ